MKIFTLLSIVILLSSCTISAKLDHFSLENNSAKIYDDFHNVWCFIAADDNSVELCSGAYRRKSKFIGPIIPIFPQLNRSSRLAYDIKHERMIEVKNLDESNQIELAELQEFQLCTTRSSGECKPVTEVLVKPSESVWLKVPDGKTHQLKVISNALEFDIKLKQFSESRWHQVTV